MGAITIYTGSPHLIDRPRPSQNPRIVYPDIKNADTDWALEQAAKCSDILSGMLGITPEEAAKRYGRRSIKVNRDGDGKVTDISLEYMNHMDDLQDFMVKRLATWVTRLYFADTSKDQLQAIILGSFWPEADIKFADFVFAQAGTKNISLTMQNPGFHFINHIRYLTATDYEHKPNICLFHFATHGRSKPMTLNEHGSFVQEGHVVDYPSGFFDASLQELMDISGSEPESTRAPLFDEYGKEPKLSDVLAYKYGDAFHG